MAHCCNCSCSPGWTIAPASTNNWTLPLRSNSAQPVKGQVLTTPMAHLSSSWCLVWIELNNNDGNEWLFWVWWKYAVVQSTRNNSCVTCQYRCRESAKSCLITTWDCSALIHMISTNCHHYNSISHSEYSTHHSWKWIHIFSIHLISCEMAITMS